MPIRQDLHQIGLFAVASLVVGVLPLVMGVFYAIRPSEARLALMRPLSLAAIFGSLAGVFSGFTVILHGLSAGLEASHGAGTNWAPVAMGVSEALVPAFFAFSCLTGAWLLVAVGMKRTGS